MTARIVLSALVVALLASCDVDTTSGGIGTSPSYDDVHEPVAASTLPLDVPPVCAVWHRDTAELADAAALAGEAPDVLVFTTGNASCSDAQTMAQLRWPGQYFVRRARQSWRAYEAP
jgi:hypothetical protein